MHNIYESKLLPEIAHSFREYTFWAREKFTTDIAGLRTWMTNRIWFQLGLYLRSPPEKLRAPIESIAAGEEDVLFWFDGQYHRQSTYLYADVVNAWVAWSTGDLYKKWGRLTPDERVELAAETTARIVEWIVATQGPAIENIMQGGHDDRIRLVDF